MGTAYFNREDIRTRLGNTICFYDGLPYYVDAKVKEDNMVRVIRLADYASGDYDKGLLVDHRDEKFNYKSPPLGYLFYQQKNAVYVSRVPDRNQSQGLSWHVLHTNPNLGRYDSTWFYSRQMEDMLLGRYPGRATAESMLSSGLAASVPISRHVALSHSRRGLIEVYYRGRPVAANFKGRGIELYDINEKSYMSKTLANHGIIVGV